MKIYKKIEAEKIGQQGYDKLLEKQTINIRDEVSAYQHIYERTIGNCGRKQGKKKRKEINRAQTRISWKISKEPT